MGLPKPKTAKLAGKTISYRETGKGPNLVLLHGIGSASDSWEEQFEHFGGRFRVLAWDAPGYRDSDPFDDPSPEAGEYADVLAKFLQELKIKRCHLLGHSLGALIAGAVARRHGSVVQSLVLANAAVGHGRLDPVDRAAKLNVRIYGMAELGPEGLAEERAPRLLSSKASPEAIEKVRAIMAKLRPEGYVHAARALAMGDLLKDVAGLDVPALVTCGTEDIVTSEASNKELAAAMKNARYEPLLGLGHISYVENPNAFNKVVDDFLAEQKAAAA